MSVAPGYLLRLSAMRSERSVGGGLLPVEVNALETVRNDEIGNVLRKGLSLGTHDGRSKDGVCLLVGRKAPTAEGNDLVSFYVSRRQARRVCLCTLLKPVCCMKTSHCCCTPDILTLKSGLMAPKAKWTVS
jgi:hypothetical protein